LFDGEVRLMGQAEEFYRMLSEKGLDDYGALDQGEVGTRARHMWAVEVCGRAPPGYKLFDLGCGTGLVLDVLSRAGCLPDWYVGADLLENRRTRVMERLAGHGVKGEYLTVSEDDVVGERLFRSGEEFDVALALGVLGSGDLHGVRRTRTFLWWFTRLARAGVASAPVTHRRMLGVSHQWHLAWDDVEEYLIGHLPSGMVVHRHTPKEVVFVWGVRG
jgi:hypothetical protein